VLGSPIAHSLSPALHRAAYAHLGLDWQYDAREVREEELPAFLASLDGSWRGLSLTMPLKRAVVPLLDELSDRAVLAAAANTVVLDQGRRVGHNTDIPGISTALLERYGGPVGSALVLGGGATAASALLGLADLGCTSATLAVRDPERVAGTLAAVARHPTPPEVEVRVLGSAVAPTADVLVSTIPADAQGSWVLGLVDRVRVVFEVLYHPWPTPLATRARAVDTPLVGGLDLLVHQAAAQVELMTGHAAPVEAMRAAGERALATR
jgi:shikimate dehydrogenase